jgi:hypothetical protein
MPRRLRTHALLALLIVAGCGDPATDDDRGYTKAPLENPGLIIESTDEHALREFGRPNLPVAREIEPPAEPAAPAGS